MPVSRLVREGLQAARSVARLLIRRYENGAAVPGDTGLYWGTGWLIGDGLMLTNHHVINARDRGESAASVQDFDKQAANTAVEFDADSDDRAPEKAKIAKIEAADSKLDYALLRIEAPRPGRT